MHLTKLRMTIQSSKRIVSLAMAAGALLALPAAAQTALSNQGIKFPDGTVQTTAGGDSCINPNDPADEMIFVGGVCIDKYEASVWSQPDGGTQLVSEADIDTACPDNGQDCKDKIFARSVPGVVPASNITWFQAQQALANSGKRLPTNAEWQMAVAGTPDPGHPPGSEDCNTNSSVLDATGERSNCFSDWGAHDMVGNLWEWVADWGDNASGCALWSSTFGDDLSCVGLGEGEGNSHFPGAFIRGGGFESGTSAGPFAVESAIQPSGRLPGLGFRGAR